MEAALAKYQKGDLAGAIAEWTHLIDRLQTGPITSSAYQHRGRAYREQGDLTRAFADHDRAIELTPQDSDAYWQRGEDWRMRKDLPSAITDCDRAIELNPKNPTAFLIRGMAHDDARHADLALADLNRAIDLNAGLGAILARGKHLTHRASPQAALADLDRVIARMPNHGEAYALRAECYFLLQRHDDALAEIDRALKLAPNHAPAYLTRSWVKNNTGHPDEAWADQTRAIELDPSFADAVRDRARLGFALGKKAEAIADVSRAEELKTVTPGLLFQRGAAYAEMRQFARALPDLNVAVQRLGTPLVFSVRGSVRWNLHDREKAADDFDEAIRLDPTLMPAYAGRGNAREWQHDYAGALADFVKVTELTPEIALGYEACGGVHFHQHQWRAACDDFNKAAERKGTRAYVFFLRYLARLALGEAEGARDELRAASDQHFAKPEAEWERIHTRFLLGEIDEAAYLKDSVDGKADVPHGRECEGWYYAGALRLLKGDRATAATYFRHCVALNIEHYAEDHAAREELWQMERAPAK